MENMMHRYRIVLLGFLALLMSFSTFAAGDGDLWVGPVAMVCLVQNPVLSDTPLGSDIAKNRQFSQAVNSMKTTGTTCLESRQWISTELCNELFNRGPKEKLQASSLYQKYGDEIAGLNELFSCMSSKNEQKSAK